ncbi:hypothetical protein PRIPAC_93394 [Pristionchus pacificus]|uniref:Uncharacterized protein n=1 Tax=Pristionchus pacificus TaxID=54126 RepID=A0A2A6BIH0_PRIPA|nr:hypothetical protein PRIPAC_93394 [Pristionchus pacificus]|eukprot:PDM65653.1 hypothetical protein PRIPAC_45567 [Pristionchus pacificus]
MNSRSELDNNSVEHEFERTFFSLNSLPSEIRWKIFGFLTGSIGAMRLVSKTWRAMTDEWAIPENLPAFFLIDIKEVAKVTEDCMNVGIEFLKRHAACFGMLRDLAGDLENFPENSRDEGALLKITCKFYEWCVRIAFDITYDSPELERLQSCISAKARRVDIARPKSGPERNGEMSLAFYDVVSKILKPLKHATQLNLFQHNISNDNSQRLKNLFSHISVRGMYFTVNVQTCPKDFLIDMSELIKCFTIRLVKPQARESYSVRDKSASWVDIILAMFHCGACSIHLDTYCVGLFSSEDMQRIVEVLANRRSPFHLKAGIHQEPSRILAKAVKDIRKDIKAFTYLFRQSTECLLTDCHSSKAVRLLLESEHMEQTSAGTRHSSILNFQNSGRIQAA